MTADEPTAIRPRKDDETGGLPVRISWGMRTGPLSQTAEADRCRTCWPTTKETQ